MNDLISRAAVVDAIEGVDWYHINKNGEMVHGANDAEHQAWYKADDIYAAIERVPSAQPVAKDINVPVKDYISRQAALDAIKKLEKPAPTAQHLSAIFDCEDIIVALPSAQPERKNGHWLRYGEDGYPNNEDTVFWQCNQCLEQYTGRTKRIPNFCPNCGAKMDGGDGNGTD